MHMRTWLLYNPGLKLLSLALAAFLWIVVLGEQKVDVTVHVPLQLALPQGLFMTNDPVDSLDIHLRGPKTLVTSLAPREVALFAPPQLAGHFPQRLGVGRDHPNQLGLPLLLAPHQGRQNLLVLRLQTLVLLDEVTRHRQDHHRQQHEREQE